MLVLAFVAAICVLAALCRLPNYAELSLVANRVSS
jgi:hypothetical protein